MQVCPDCELVLRNNKCSCGYELKFPQQQTTTYKPPVAKRRIFGSEHQKEAREVFDMAMAGALNGGPLAATMEAMEEKYPGLGWGYEAMTVRKNEQKREEIKRR